MDGRRFLTLSQATARLIADAVPVDGEIVPLVQALNRILAQPVVAAFDQPRAATSAMDGWAVRAADLAAAAPDNPVELRRIGVAPAGKPLRGVVEAGETARIFTGGLLPTGADAVAMQEDVTETAGGARFFQAVAAGRHVRPAGQDFAAGRILLEAGTRLTPGALGLAAAAGKAHLQVRRRPRVGVLAVGDELALPGVAFGAAGVVASNLFVIAGLVDRMGGEPVLLGVGGDDIDDLRGRLATAAQDVDLIVVCGGTAAGAYDVVGRLAANAPGWENWRLAMRPCRGVAVGKVVGKQGATFVLGLPGNPSGAFVGAVLLLGPLLRRLAGDAPPPRMLAARVGTALEPTGENTAVYFAKLRRRGAAVYADLLTGKQGGGLTAPAAADALIVLPPGRPASPPGALAEALLIEV